MKQREDEAEEEQDKVAAGLAAAHAGEGQDLGAALLSMQAGAGNAVLADLLADIEAGEKPAAELLPGAKKSKDEKAAERELKGAADRATSAMLQRRLSAAKVNPFAARIAAELTAFERRLNDAREYGWIGTDAAALSSELEELENKLGRAEREEQSSAALSGVDLKRRPLSERVKKAITESTSLAKPGMALYALEDFQALAELQVQLGELQKHLIGNRVQVDESKMSLGSLSDVTTSYAKAAAAKLGDEVDKLATQLEEVELVLSEISARHARANAEDREQLNQLMGGLEPRLKKAPRDAMAGGASRQEIDYLIKKAYLEQHDATQRLAKDEMWELVTGFKPTEGKVCYFDIARRMGDWKIHFSLDYGVMRAVDVTYSESDIRDALMGGSSPSFLRSHVTAEVLTRSDDRNPRFYYNAPRMTLKHDFLSTREGKAVDKNKKAYEGNLREAFDEKAEELVKTIYEVLEERKLLKSVVEKVGETLNWVG